MRREQRRVGRDDEIHSVTGRTDGDISPFTLFLLLFLSHFTNYG